VASFTGHYLAPLLVRKTAPIKKKKWFYWVS
jgi:hypothetical protein